MAGGRKRVDGLLFAWHLAGVVGFMPLTGKELNPEQINPFGSGVPRGTRTKLDEVKAFIAGIGLAALGGRTNG